MVLGHVVIEESLPVVCRHGLVLVLLQEVVGSLKGDSRVQVTGVLLVGLVSLVLQLGVQSSSTRWQWVSCIKSVTLGLKAGNGIFRAYFEVPCL